MISRGDMPKSRSSPHGSSGEHRISEASGSRHGLIYLAELLPEPVVKLHLIGSPGVAIVVVGRPTGHPHAYGHLRRCHTRMSCCHRKPTKGNRD